MNETQSAKPLGFWSCWSLTVGCMIGSGVFLLPSVLAPYGLLSFGGWVIAGAGSIALALVFGRLASRTRRDGGPYVYAQEAFGDLTGFMMAWCYWVSYWMGIPVVAIAFVGYLGVFIPALNESVVAQAGAALALIATLTFVNIRGLKEMSAVQITMTILKLLPLAVIALLSLYAGDIANLPTFNSSSQPILHSLMAIVLITLWPFTGFEVATLPAGNVKNPERTIPRALIFGMLTVTAVYLGATTAVMLLVPPDVLAHSTAPFSDAARLLGGWGPYFVAAGALIATAGTLNGLIFTCGQMPMAVAIDKLAPSWLATTNKGGSPYLALVLSSVLGSILLIANYTRGLIEAFTFLLMMSTSLSLIYYFVISLAEVRHSWRNARGWVSVALFGCAYSVFAAFGSGVEILTWNVLTMVIAVPLYFLLRRRSTEAPISPTS